MCVRVLLLFIVCMCKQFYCVCVCVHVSVCAVYHNVSTDLDDHCKCGSISFVLNEVNYNS